jgi:AmmeMemoRadiSam system protein B
MSTRRPIVAGQFYPASKAELEQEIKKSFTHKFGPGALPGKRTNKKVYGCIAPHAGYFFSGAGAAWVYKEITETEFPDVYIILGVNHSGHKTCSSDEDWETPLGTVKCDTEFVKTLEGKGIPIDTNAHSREHSIEVQLPFLQFVSLDRITKLKVVPIMIADERFDKWGRAIQETAKDLKRRVTIICSSDFTHYGDNYGYVPFENNVKENMAKLDLDAANFITKPNPKSFIAYTDKTGATICGRCGISTLLWLMKYLFGEEKKGKLLKYYTSGDVLGDYQNAVGYAAIVFK